MLLSIMSFSLPTYILMYGYLRMSFLMSTSTSLYYSILISPQSFIICSISMSLSIPTISFAISFPFRVGFQFMFGLRCHYHYRNRFGCRFRQRRSISIWVLVSFPCPSIGLFNRLWMHVGVRWRLLFRFRFPLCFASGVNVTLSFRYWLPSLMLT